MKISKSFGASLKWAAALPAVFALAFALAACGGDTQESASAAELSALDAKVASQSAELQSLGAQLSALQSELAGASAQVAALQASIDGMAMEVDEVEPAADYSEDIHELEHGLEELSDAVSENSDAIDSLPSAMSAIAGTLLTEHAGEHDGLEVAIQDAFDDHGAAHEELNDSLEEVINRLLREGDDADEEALALLERIEMLETAVAPADTIAYVEEAIAKYDRDGFQAILNYYNSPESVEGDLYLFVLDTDYKVIVHPTVPSNIGMDIRGPLGTDITGYDFGVEFVTVDEQGKWIDYVYVNPAADYEYERKHTWAVRHAGLIFGSGWYEGGLSLKDDPEVYTRAFVERAISRYDEEGLEATAAYYNSPESIDGQWYVFIGDENDVIAAHGAIPERVGLPYSESLGPDGYPAGAQVAAAATEDGAWTSYIYLNPETGNVETKHSWVVRHDGLTFGSGWYEEGPSKDDVPAYTQAFVRRALNLYDAVGLEGAADYYNSSESIDEQWYVFIGDENDVMVAHAPVPENVGMSYNEIVSPDGYPAGAQVAAAATEGGAWTSYSYLNPTTGNVETKHSWVVRRDGLIFGSGWYEEGPSKDDAPAYTQAFVQRALNLYDDLGLEGAADYYNSENSVDGQWYVFIVDEDNIIVGHYNDNARGENLLGDIGTDETGYDFGSDMITATEEGKWVSYVFDNPVPDESHFKHSWVVRHDGLLFGSGYYGGEAPESP